MNIIEFHNFTNLIGYSLNEIQDKASYEIRTNDVITALTIVGMRILSDALDEESLSYQEYIALQSEIFVNTCKSVADLDVDIDSMF